MAPDNGVLTLVLKEMPPRRVVELTERRYARPTVSRTFEGRDRFGPAAAWLAKGIELSAFGRTLNDWQTLNVPEPIVTDAQMIVEVVRVDRFGNLVTNVDRRTFDRFVSAERVGIVAGTTAVGKVVTTYADADPGALCALFGSSEHLEIAINGGSAAERLALGRGAKITISKVSQSTQVPGVPEVRGWSAVAAVSGSATLTSVGRAFTARLARRGPRELCGTFRGMVTFELGDDHRLLEQSVREWAAREVAPRIHDLDRAHHFDRSILTQMASLGLLGISVPVEYGGAGMDYISLGLACEELEYVDTSLRVIMSVHAGLNSLTLLSWGTEDQKQRYLTPQAQGARIASYGLTEPSAGSDARGIQSVAIKRGDRYSLTGEKMWISLADVADSFLVFAWSDLDKKRDRDPAGLSAFIVERAFKGFSSGTLKEKWGILAGNTGFFKMEEVEVPRENLVGREGEGFKIAMFALDQGATLSPLARRASSARVAMPASDTRRRGRPSVSRSAHTSS